MVTSSWCQRRNPTLSLSLPTRSPKMSLALFHITSRANNHALISLVIRSRALNTGTVNPSSQTSSKVRPQAEPESSSDDQKDSTLKSETKKEHSIAERDAALLAKLQDMEGGAGAVDEKEWNGLAKSVKDNMVRILAILMLPIVTDSCNVSWHSQFRYI